ncbi:MAG: hypothetical protein R3E96_14345 [Planctomycetota bacterium]
MQRTPPSPETLLTIARDLTTSLSATDRQKRLVEAVHNAIPCDAVVLLRKEGDDLVPLAARGLSEDALGLRFTISEHPRFTEICANTGPTRFADNSPLPDPMTA